MLVQTETENLSIFIKSPQSNELEFLVKRIIICIDNDNHTIVIDCFYLDFQIDISNFLLK